MLLSFTQKITATLGCFLLIIFPSFGQDKMKVVTTFTILADIASNIAGDAADVVSITKPGAEIHGYQPTPQDIVRAYDADLILWNGMNLELWFEQFFSNLEEVPAVTLTERIDPIIISSGSYSGKPNPHAWMGVNEALIYIENISKAFSNYDTKNAQVYKENAQNYKNELLSLMRPYQQSISKIPDDKRWLVTCEGAFSYLARDFGLKELYLWPMNADEVGTPQQVKSVIDVVRKHNIRSVFCESTVSSASAKQVVRETNAKFGGILYVDSLSEKGGRVPTYLDLLRVTVSTIEKGLMLGIN
tara:strand:+ start:2267 stop:3172 length:906 start_codon:yes stop_codon:yes gene_type:complete